jgi:hypothetical protein
MIADAARQRQLYVDTPWPELLADIDLNYVMSTRLLRTQMRNVAMQPPGTYMAPPIGLPVVALGYGHLEMDHGVFAAMEAKLPMRARRVVWDLPDMGPCPIDTGGAPLAVIRPVMRRYEWDNEARNPLPEYVNWIAGDLKRRGFAVVAIADERIGWEWIEGGTVPPNNAAFLRGEFTVRQLMATVRDAAVVVGGVGWIVPASIALGNKAFIVLGGNGGMNAPDKIIDRRMDGSRIGFAIPEEYCRCLDMRHGCDKRIPDLKSQWLRWVESELRMPRRSSA